jgi:hypothetical protein
MRAPSRCRRCPEGSADTTSRHPAHGQQYHQRHEAVESRMRRKPTSGSGGRSVATPAPRPRPTPLRSTTRLVLGRATSVRLAFSVLDERTTLGYRGVRAKKAGLFLSGTRSPSADRGNLLLQFLYPRSLHRLQRLARLRRFPPSSNVPVTNVPSWIPRSRATSAIRVRVSIARSRSMCWQRRAC